MMRERQQLAEAAYLFACDLEIRAFKPGNVSDESEGHDMTPEDFRQSARASAKALTQSDLTLGERILLAIEATRAVAGCNTNLGIVLLAAPLIEAFFLKKPGTPIQTVLADILAKTTVGDAERVFKAIRHAAPGGLGEVPEADVRDAPRVTLLESMRLARERDLIARQYANNFEDIFHIAVPLYHSRLSSGDEDVWATVAVYLKLLSDFPDSHIERKFGGHLARDLSGRATQINARISGPGWPTRIYGELQVLDRELKQRGINPGTTADLTVAALLAYQLERCG